MDRSSSSPGRGMRNSRRFRRRGEHAGSRLSCHARSSLPWSDPRHRGVHLRRRHDDRRPFALGRAHAARAAAGARGSVGGRTGFVFSKGILEDGGFAWRSTGSVRGYSSNRVPTQYPAPGTRVVDTGAPTVTLRLVRGAYEQLGTPRGLVAVRRHRDPQAGRPRYHAGEEEDDDQEATPAKKSAPREEAGGAQEGRKHTLASTPHCAPARVHRQERPEGAARRDRRCRRAPSALEAWVAGKPRNASTSSTGSTSTRGSSPARSSAGGTARRHCRR